MVKSETRSGLLYEVQRLLGMAALYDTLPKYLILENVKNLVSKKFKADFDSWLEWLDGVGYNTYWKVLNAADYGIPQKRQRVFAISIRKDIDKGFIFPEPQPLTTSLIDFLEDEVDEKYYLTNETFEYLKRHGEESNYRFNVQEKESIAKTLTTKPDRTHSNYVKEL